MTACIGTSDHPVDWETLPNGAALLQDSVFNKGTAFTNAERDALGLHGLLPPHVSTQDEQVARVMGNFQIKDSDLEKYVFMIALLDRNQRLFYRVVMDHIEEMIPILYTPTVGRACQEYAHIFRRPRGIYLSMDDRDGMAEILANWPQKEVRVIVVTDGERILGLGDLGANGMGIPIGKLILYSACAGVDPCNCLPVTLDVGTNNETLLQDPLYLGRKRPRLRGKPYDDVVDAFINAATRVFPEALIQFEDFGKSNAFRLLNHYRERIRTFNDDIQGTAAVVLSGIATALKIKGETLDRQKILFYGAGGAGVGIANLIVSAMVHSGLDEGWAREKCWFVDSKGLVVKSRSDLIDFKRPYAHDHPRLTDLESIVESVRPTILIGASGQGGAFTTAVLRRMAAINTHPLIMALSNPTTKSECSAEAAYQQTGGRAIFASGSPFAPVTMAGRTFEPGQGNNAYIFPGVGLGVIASGASRVTDAMFFAAAHALADQVKQQDLAVGRIYPRLNRIQDVSTAIAVAVAEVAYQAGLASRPRPDDLSAFIRGHMFNPEYPNYVAETR